MRRRKSTIFFVVFGICLIAFAIALQVGWILLNLQQIVLLVLGIIFFAAIITGLVLNTTFLVREIRRNEQQNAFLNSITHELKTPIASIRLYLETMQSRDVSEEKRQEFYKIMLSDSDRLLHTVEQVLQASRTKDKARQLRMKPVDISGIVAEAAEISCSRYNLNLSTIRIGEFHDAVEIDGNHEELRTVFSNLFDNAIKYSADAPDITVKFRTRVTGWVDVFVRDKGMGISSSELGRVFNRFYRIEGGDVKGTGLGLHIVESIVKSHGGKVSVKSRGLGKGSTFAVHLPLQRRKIDKSEEDGDLKS